MVDCFALQRDCHSKTRTNRFGNSVKSWYNHSRRLQEMIMNLESSGTFKCLWFPLFQLQEKPLSTMRRVICNDDSVAGNYREINGGRKMQKS